MKKKTDFVSMFVMISILGVAISFIYGDFEIGSYFEGLEVNNLEVLLDTLNIGLGFLAFGFLFFFFIFRIGRRETDGREEQGDRLIREWEKHREDD